MTQLDGQGRVVQPAAGLLARKARRFRLISKNYMRQARHLGCWLHTRHIHLGKLIRPGNNICELLGQLFLALGAQLQFSHGSQFFDGFSSKLHAKFLIEHRPANCRMLCVTRQGSQLSIMNIGVFDSGLGGLTVLKELMAGFPQYHYVYLGDTARNPYGIRSKETISQYVREAVDFFFREKNCELVIVACNTASADALRMVQQEYLPSFGSPTKRVLGVLIPTAEQAVAVTRNKSIGIIATHGTVQSGAYLREIGKLDPAIKVMQKATPLLVPLIEEGWAHKPETNMILKKYLRSFKDARIDTLILGCTHYPVLARDVRRIMGKNVRIVTSAAATHGRFGEYLERHPDIRAILATTGGVEYYTTDSAERFEEMGKRVFHGNMGKVERVHLGN